jgi:hypothetical protein
MSGPGDTIVVHVNVKISSQALQTVVANAKHAAGRNEKGHYRVDTADKVSELISLFLEEKGFEEYVRDVDRY